jgi:MATE family multidrug resistance protein
MWATILGNIVNVVLNYLFIYVLDIPELGIVAGIGTIASRFVMLGYMHYMMQKRKSFSLFFEKFSQNIKRSVNITIIRLGSAFCHANVF